ncbi:hypothetical protein NML43_02585 [Rhodopseudomonas palustris]|uniref:hypothetical protein n=1 Tax=Rhodopseudomonas palustris TaxID=1076 RepID=UPI0020CD21DE|nr:hypothetical protein [Rhodopseudomonas palustris]MCP9625970.1 hypothetical protein [Rhodopseudomonas palustris]
MSIEASLDANISALVTFLVKERMICTLVADECVYGNDTTRKIPLLLWREHATAPNSTDCNKPFPGSVWSFADTIVSLLFARDTQVSTSVDSALNDDFFVRALNSLLQIDALIRERAIKEFELLKNSIANKDISDPQLFKRAMRTLLKDLQSYTGMPRSFVVSRTGHAEWGTANLGVTAVTCRAVRKLSEKLKDNQDSVEKSKNFLKRMSSYCYRPELSMLRLSVRQTRVCEDYKSFNVIVGMKRDHGADENGISQNYARLRLAAQRYGLSTEPCSIHSQTEKAFSELGAFLDRFNPKITGAGCLLASSESFGWALSSQNLVTDAEPSATLPAIEIISCAIGYLPIAEMDSLITIFEFSITAFEHFLLRTQPMSRGDRKTQGERISEQWSIEFTSRQIVHIFHIFESISDPIKKSAIAERWNAVYRTIDRCFQFLYSALLIKTFQVTIEERGLPFEAIPQELYAGNEFAHAPGIDIGYVTYALLIGRPLFRPDDASQSFTQLQQYLPKILGHTKDYPDILPIDVPLYRILVSKVSERVISDYHFEQGCHLVGGFLSSYSEPKHGQYRPTVYTWASAHALLALTHWRSKNPIDNESLSREVGEISARTRQLESFGKYISGFGMPAIDESGGNHFNKGILLACICFPLVAFGNLGYVVTSTICNPSNYSLLRDTIGIGTAIVLTGLISGFLWREYKWLKRAFITIQESTQKKHWCSTVKELCGFGARPNCAFGDEQEESECCFRTSRPHLLTILSVYKWTYISLQVVALVLGTLLASEPLNFWLELTHLDGRSSMSIVLVGAIFSISPLVVFLWKEHEKVARWLRPLRLCWRLLTGCNNLTRVIGEILGPVENPRVGRS